MRTFPLLRALTGETPMRASTRIGPSQPKAWLSQPWRGVTRGTVAAATGALALGLAGCASQPGQPTVAEVPGCLGDVPIAALASAYEARIAADNPPASLTPAAAACSRAKYQAATARITGPLAGYKAGLTNPAVQKRFHTDRPVWGSLGKSMLLTSPATVPAQFGARPVFEADLLVRVSSAAINQASTPEQVLASVDQIVPFIELPDLLVQKPGELNGNALTAINVGARLGVTGQPLAVPKGAAAQATLARQLADMRVQLREATGKVTAEGKTIAEGKGSDVLGNPLNAVVWLAGALKAEGRALQVGQYVSLGSFSPLLPPKAGTRISVHYEGVPGLAGASVAFE